MKGQEVTARLGPNLLPVTVAVSAQPLRIWSLTVQCPPSSQLSLTIRLRLPLEAAPRTAKLVAPRMVLPVTVTFWPFWIWMLSLWVGPAGLLGVAGVVVGVLQ